LSAVALTAAGTRLLAQVQRRRAPDRAMPAATERAIPDVMTRERYFAYLRQQMDARRDAWDSDEDSDEDSDDWDD
jgi:hypothetical protein